MFGLDPSVTGIDTVAHVIQVALTPVFMLSGVAALLNVFATRLARVSDRSHAIATTLESAADPFRHRLEAEIRYLQRRTRLLDGAVLLGSAAGGATCFAALLLFVGSLRDSVVGSLLFLCFGLALLSTSGALLMFMLEVLLASRGLRERQQETVRRSRQVHGTPGGNQGETRGIG